jgi:hypothetical protein
MKLALSWIFYHIGNITSLTLMRLGHGYGFYNRMMIWSSALDEHGKIWKDVK